MTDDMKINQPMPRVTYKKTKEIPLKLITDTYYSANSRNEASFILARETGFTDRGIRYALTKMEIQGILDPTLLKSASTKKGAAHIAVINRKRAEHGVAEARMPRATERPPEEELVMLTIHMRAESDGLGGHGFHALYMEASLSKLVYASADMAAIADEMSHELTKFVSREYNDSIADLLTPDPQYEGGMAIGLEVEPASQSSHYDGETRIRKDRVRLNHSE